MKHAICLLSSVALLAATFAPGALAQTVRLSGSPAVIDAVVAPHRAAVERATGLSLQLVSSDTGQGLVDLASQKADVAMSSERIDAAVASAARAGKQLHPSALRVHELKKEFVRPDEPASGAAPTAVAAPRLSRQLSLVTLGSPSPQAAKVIEALKRAAAGQLPHEAVAAAR